MNSHRGLYSNEVYADGTSALNDSASKSKSAGSSSISATYLQAGLSEIPEQLVELVKRQRLGEGKRKVNFNRGPTEVFFEEKLKGAPWREKAERLQQIEDAKACGEHKLKRITLMAQQVCAGMKSTYAANFDASDLIPILRMAEAEASKRDGDPKLTRLYQSAMKFDLKAVSIALECFSKRDKAQTVPAIGISSRPPPPQVVSKPRTWSS